MLGVIITCEFEQLKMHAKLILSTMASVQTLKYFLPQLCDHQS